MASKRHIQRPGWVPDQSGDVHNFQPFTLANEPSSWIGFYGQSSSCGIPDSASKDLHCSQVVWKRRRERESFWQLQRPILDLDFTVFTSFALLLGLFQTTPQSIGLSPMPSFSNFCKGLGQRRLESTWHQNSRFRNFYALLEMVSSPNLIRETLSRLQWERHLHFWKGLPPAWLRTFVEICSWSLRSTGERTVQCGDEKQKKILYT